MRGYVAKVCLGLLALAWALPAVAQVPQDTTFTGRLVDAAGTPLAGPVDLELRIFDAEALGTQLYSEQHADVALDATGGFSLRLGMGGSPSGTFDAALFSDTNRWLEVVVDGDVLMPRQIIASVPWALVAQQANKVVPDPNGPFEDCGDGTVADPQTGLLWEKKTGSGGGANLADPHDVDNTYQWSVTGTAPDGGAFTDFLAKLNDPVFGAAATASDATGCFAGHCDWRLANIVELQTILDCSFGMPCIDPIFGPTIWSPGGYWSASSLAGTPGSAWFAGFGDGHTGYTPKAASFFVRAVRIGSCN